MPCLEISKWYVLRSCSMLRTKTPRRFLLSRMRKVPSSSPLILMSSMAFSRSMVACSHVSRLDSGFGGGCSSRLLARSKNPLARARSDGVSFFGVRDMQGAEKARFLIASIGCWTGANGLGFVNTSPTLTHWGRSEVGFHATPNLGPCPIFQIFFTHLSSPGAFCNIPGGPSKQPRAAAPNL